MTRHQLPFPAYLDRREPAAEACVELTVAFRDCDPMGVLWHGNHLAYCEAARNVLGKDIGFGLAEFIALGLYAPVVRSQVLHLGVARPDELLAVRATIYPTAQPRLYHRYELSVGGREVATAETEQVITDREMVLVLRQPDLLARALRGAPRGRV